MSSTGGNRYALSPISFGYAQPNLNGDALKDMLAGLGVKGGWSALIGVSSAAGLNLPALSNDYRNALERRHASAHDPRVDVPLSDLQNFVLHGTAVGLAFDALVSRAAYRLRAGDARLAGGTDFVEHGQIGVIKFDDGAPARQQRWFAARRAAKRSGDIIVITRANVPVAWHPSDLENGRR